jgi:hypothetical protein
MRLFLLVLLAAEACGSLFGFGCEGHQIVALIAGQHLTDQARAAVYRLLSDHPIDPSLDRFCKPPATDAMADAATWADDARRAEKTATWHYLDIPRGAEPADPAKYCAPIGESHEGKDRPGCLLTALQHEFGILKDRSRPSAERATALRYIIHLISDLHQPLHTTSNDDQGGNCTIVTLFGDSKPTNLHAAWDYGIIAHYLKQNNETPAQMAALLDRRYQSQGQKWLHDAIDFSQWILEGHELADRIVYGKLRPRLPVALAEDGPGCAVEKEKTAALRIDIGESYIARVMPVIDRQLAKAGYRLADVLNAAL